MIDIAPRRLRRGATATWRFTPTRGLQRRWQLPDGRDVVIRPIRPEDATMERAFVDGLSSESRYNRFMYRMDKADAEDAGALHADRLRPGDGPGRGAGRARQESRILAVARYVTNPDGAVL
jgi:acetyltransferase